MTCPVMVQSSANIVLRNITIRGVSESECVVHELLPGGTGTACSLVMLLTSSHFLDTYVEISASATANNGLDATMSTRLELAITRLVVVQVQPQFKSPSESSAEQCCPMILRTLNPKAALCLCASRSRPATVWQKIEASVNLDLATTRVGT